MICVLMIFMKQRPQRNNALILELPMSHVSDYFIGSKTIPKASGAWLPQSLEGIHHPM